MGSAQTATAEREATRATHLASSSREGGLDVASASATKSRRGVNAERAAIHGRTTMRTVLGMEPNCSQFVPPLAIGSPSPQITTKSATIDTCAAMAAQNE